MSERPVNCPELPAPPGRIAAFAIIALISGIGVARMLNRPAGPECNGALTARKTFVSASSEGIVANFLVSEGAAVRIGAPLLTLRDNQLEQEIAAQRRSITAIEAQLVRDRAEAELEIKWRLKAIDAEICEIQLRSATYLKEKYDFDMQRTMLADVVSRGRLSQVEQPQPLFSPVALEQPAAPPQRLTTVLQMEAATNASEVSAVQVEICDIREKNLIQLKEDLPQQIRRTSGIDVTESRLLHAREELEQLEARERELQITSPAIGKVGLFLVHPGDRLHLGQPIVELLDESERRLIVYVPSRQITHFTPGTKVAVSFPGGLDRTGRVTEVAPQAQPAPGDSSQSDPFVTVNVEPTGAVWPHVPIGSQVKVHVEK